ncbi:MAG TPA: Hsp20/alpha crystallin family protein [Thermoanaerobaculia bacterium]
MIHSSRFHAELDRLFEEVMKLAAGEPRAGEHQPLLDVVETASEVVVLLEVPGIAREDLEVTVEGRTVVVSGRKRSERPEGVVRFHRVEREEGRFERRVELLHPVDTHRGRARTAGGLLIVEFPKVQEKRARRRILEIEAGEEEA